VVKRKRLDSARSNASTRGGGQHASRLGLDDAGSPFLPDGGAAGSRSSSGAASGKLNVGAGSAFTPHSRASRSSQASLASASQASQSQSQSQAHSRSHAGSGGSGGSARSGDDGSVAVSVRTSQGSEASSEGGYVDGELLQVCFVLLRSVFPVLLPVVFPAVFNVVFPVVFSCFLSLTYPPHISPLNPFLQPDVLVFPIYFLYLKFAVFGLLTRSVFIVAVDPDSHAFALLLIFVMNPLDAIMRDTLGYFVSQEVCAALLC
jgi:hypothetical protein